VNTLHCKILGTPMVTWSLYWQAISVTQSGNPSEKLELAFRLYDIDRNGAIDQQEMADIIQVSIRRVVKKPYLPRHVGLTSPKQAGY